MTAPTAFALGTVFGIVVTIRVIFWWIRRNERAWKRHEEYWDGAS